MDTENKKDQFNNWNAIKIKLSESAKTSNLLYKAGEIWWIHVGINIGQEVYGKGRGFMRPILIIKKLSRHLCLGIPLTSKVKTGDWFHLLKSSDRVGTLQLHQIRCFSSRRLRRRMYTISEKQISQVKEKLKSLLELS